jgi:YgiT-type zinc finger domain-containing protein
MGKLAEEKETAMKAFSKCPMCAGELVEKTVEKLLRGGSDTALIKVKADVCLHCGEHLYSQETVRRFEEIRRKLQRRQTKEFRKLGKSFEVV